MTNNTLKVINGRPMYLVSRLINDFDPIFCQADKGTILFIGARDHLAVTIKVNDREKYSPNNDSTFNYVFKIDDVGRNIEWFTKANASKRLTLELTPKENHLEIHNKLVDGKFISFINNAPIPRIQEMEGGIFIRITNLREMVEQVNSVADSIVKLKFFNSKLTMCGADHEDPIYNIPIGRYVNYPENEIERITFCLKHVLSISSQLLLELRPRFAELRFYPGGAIQINAEEANLSANCLLTAVKHI